MQYIDSTAQSDHITVQIKQSQSSPQHPQPKQGFVVAPFIGVVSVDVDVAGPVRSWSSAWAAIAMAVSLPSRGSDRVVMTVPIGRKKTDRIAGRY